MTSQKRDIQAFTTALRAHGAQASLKYLNAGVPHRYTAVYRIEGDMLRNLLLEDKLGEIRTDFLEVVPLAASFCQFVLKDGMFKTEDSTLDARLDGNPYKGVVLCYHGVPMLDLSGEVSGTLCHFDLFPREIEDCEFDLLMRAGRVLPEFVKGLQRSDLDAASSGGPASVGGIPSARSVI